MCCGCVWEGSLVESFRRGDRAKVIAESHDDRFPIGTIVIVVDVDHPFGAGPEQVTVYRQGKGNVPESALPANILQRI